MFLHPWSVRVWMVTQVTQIVIATHRILITNEKSGRPDLLCWSKSPKPPEVGVFKPVREFHTFHSLSAACYSAFVSMC